MLCRIGKEAFHTRSTSCDCAPTVTLASRQFYYDAEVTSPGFSEIFFRRAIGFCAGPSWAHQFLAITGMFLVLYYAPLSIGV